MDDHDLTDEDELFYLYDDEEDPRTEAEQRACDRLGRLRSTAEIDAMQEELYERVWYFRHRTGGNHPTGEPSARRIEERYDDLSLDPYRMAEDTGRLSALRWALGWEWDESADM